MKPPPLNIIVHKLHLIAEYDGMAGVGMEAFCGTCGIGFYVKRRGGASADFRRLSDAHKRYAIARIKGKN